MMSDEPTLRKRGEMSWGAKLMKFIGEELPPMLAEFAEGQEADLLEALAKKYRERRDAQMADRSAQVEEDRAKVDARLEERKAKEKKGGA